MIKLTNEEIQVIEKQLRGDLTAWNATAEEQVLIGSVVEKAEALEEELDAYDESGDDLIAWFYGKYKAQQSA